MLPCGDLRGERPGQAQPAQRDPQRPARDRHRQVRQQQPRARAARRIGPDGIAAFSDTLHIAKPRLWSPQDPQLYDVSFTVRVDGKKVAGYSLHSGIRSIKVSGGRLILNGQFLNMRGVGLHEDSKAEGFAIDNARRDAAGRSGQGARLDGAADALPAASLHARAGRPARAADLVRDPGLLAQDRGPQGAGGAAPGGPGAQPQHRGQREPPVGDPVVDRQRALLAARAGADLLHQRGGQVRQGAGPDAAGRPRGRRLPELALPGRAVQVARRASGSTTTSAGTRGRAGRSSIAPSSRATSTRSAPATRTRRSSSASSAPRPTATARPRRRAPGPSSRSGSTTSWA